LIESICSVHRHLLLCPFYYTPEPPYLVLGRVVCPLSGSLSLITLAPLNGTEAIDCGDIKMYWMRVFNAKSMIILIISFLFTESINTSNSSRHSSGVDMASHRDSRKLIVPNDRSPPDSVLVLPPLPCSLLCIYH
jgi:hypothetical protein